MRSGRLKHIVTLQRRTDSRSNQGRSGEVVPEFEDFAAKVPADIDFVTAGEFVAGAQVQSNVTAKIRIRFRDDVDETCRVKRITRYAEPQIVEYWNIVGILPDSDSGRQELLLMCSKVTAEGWRS